MKRFYLPALVSALAIFSLPLFAANSLIGVATTIGTISVNQTVVSGNADVADGARLQTTTTPSDVRLAGGADLRLATRSTGSFFSGHVLLDQGALRAVHFNGVTVEAAQLQITTDEPGTSAVVRLTRKTVEVASIGGSVSVMDGGMLTRVASGTKMSFEQTGGQSGAQPADQTTTGAGAAPAPKKIPSDEKTFVWAIGIAAVAALAIGLTAAAQGKSPF